jgi:peptidoglycan hydrolase-like protein with peptidoglycan-binding domain
VAVALAVAIVGAGAAVGHSVTSQAPPPQGLVEQGSSGAAVAAVQSALGIPADGYFGARTEANVRLFQTRHGLLVDGIVGPQTRAALGLGSPSGGGSGEAPATAGQAQVGPTAGQPQAAPVSAPPQQAAAPGAGGLQRIAQCESGGNPGAVGGGGRYRGKYQFTRETWRAVGGNGDPAAAPEAEQDRRAAVLYGRGGASHWPSCG